MNNDDYQQMLRANRRWSKLQRYGSRTVKVAARRARAMTSIDAFAAVKDVLQAEQCDKRTLAGVR